jgi:hypothetical protein
MGGLMASQKLVRCEIKRPDNGSTRTVRYVPLEIYGLWEFLMRNRHQFEITDNVASLWIDVDENPEAAYGEGQYERVTEVTLLRYSEQDGMFGRVSRYFPTQDYPELKKTASQALRKRARAGGSQPPAQGAPGDLD